MVCVGLQAEMSEDEGHSLADTNSDSDDDSDLVSCDAAGGSAEVCQRYIPALSAFSAQLLYSKTDPCLHLSIQARAVAAPTHQAACLARTSPGSVASASATGSSMLKQPDRDA